MNKTATPVKPALKKEKKEGGKFQKKHVFLSLGVFFVLVILVIFFIRYMNFYTARNYLKEAKEFHDQGNSYWAVQYANNALLYDKEYSDAYLFKAGLLLEWNNYEDCMTQIGSAIKFSDAPTDDMHFIYGKCLYKIGQLKEAYPQLMKVYEATPDRDSVSYFLGDIYKNVFLDYPAAVLAYKSFFDRNRNSVDGALGVADSYYKLENYDEALKFYNIILRINDDNPDALYGIAKCYFKKNNQAEGCEKALLASNFGHTKAQVLLQTYCNVSVESQASLDSILE